MKRTLNKYSPVLVHTLCLASIYLLFAPSSSCGIDFPNSKNFNIQILSKHSKDSTAAAIGKVSITYKDIEIYRDLSKSDIFPYPEGPIIGHVKVGETVDLLDIYPNDYESGPSYKIKTSEGRIGYVKKGYFKFIEPYGDRGAIIFIRLTRPYEYEGDVKMVDEDIMKFRNFIKQYPQSKYKLEALLNIVGLHLYTFQLTLSTEQRYTKLKEIKEIYKIVFKEVIKPELSSQVNIICDEIMADYEKRILLSRNIDDFSIESFKSLFFNKIINSVIPSSME